MRSLHAQQRLDTQGDSKVEAGLWVLQVDAADLANAVEAIAKRVRVHAQPRRRLLLLARLEVCAQRRHQAALARAVVLHQGTEMAPAVVDEPLVGDGGEQAREAELRHRDHLPPALEASQ